MAHPEVDRFTHNFLIYDSGALGKPYEGRLFGVEPLQGRVVMSQVTPVGATFQTKDVGYAVTSGDKGFRPVDIKLGPDGALYVADWYDGQVNHYRNHEGKIDASNGRVYRLRAAGEDRRPTYPLAKATSDELLQALDFPWRWHREQALRLLGEKSAPMRPLELEEIIRKSGPVTALNALWALHLAGRLDDALMATALDHGDTQVRAWTVRLLGDERRLTPAASVKFAELAAKETSIEVRAQLACTAKRLPVEQAFPIVRNLLARDSDATDQRQPLLLWWAIESQCASNRAAVVGMFSDRELWRAPLVQQHILTRLARRFASTGGLEDLAVVTRLFALAPDAASTGKLVRGFEEAFQGRPLSGVPDSVLEALDRAGGDSLVLGLRQGKAEALDRALAVVGDPKKDMTRRLLVVAALGEVRQPRSVSTLLELVRGTNRMELRQAALGALQIQADTATAHAIVALIPGLPSGLKASAVSLLTGRASWAGELLAAVEAGTVAKELVSAEQLRGIRAAGPEVARRAAVLWPPEKPVSTAVQEAEIARLIAVAGSGGGSPYAGKALFMNRCGACHRLFAQGAEVGPDLTAYQRTDLPGLLLNILNPSAEIREGYEAFTVETKDGRNLTGFVVDKDPQVVVLRTADARTVSIPRNDVESMERAPGSIMPEGLLTGLTDAEVRDLFAYIRSTQPLNDGK
jgi:putative heme-binding domain-containing protein